jgi:predicted small lipoprotein YifL
LGILAADVMKELYHMWKQRNHYSQVLIIVALLAILLAGCGQPEPTEAPPPTETTAPTATDTTFESPLATATATPNVVILDPSASALPTGTPNPDRTPVAIVQAEIEADREVITIQNLSNEAYDISGWVLFNLNADKTYRFPDGLVLEPGDSVQVYSAVPEVEVPDGAYFWTEDKVWTQFPADVLLLHNNTRLMYWYVAYK